MFIAVLFIMARNWKLFNLGDKTQTQKHKYGMQFLLYVVLAVH